MKIVLQTRGDMRRFRTHLLFTDISKLIVVCHTRDQMERIRAEIPGIRVEVHGLPEGPTAIGPIRDWVERNLIPYGTWYAGIDDNVQTIWRVAFPYYDLDKTPEDCRTREIYRGESLHGDGIQRILAELVEKCEEQVTIYGGFGWMENPMFRGTKWQTLGYAKAKLYVKKNISFPWCWDPRIQVMYDHAHTFRAIALHGSVAINRFVYVQHPQYEGGGLGSHAERMPFRKPTLDFLYEHFEGLVVPFRGDHDKPIVRIHGARQLDEWRRRYREREAR